MSRSRLSDDRGSTLPIYMWLTTIILFVALAFFAFAQAASARNGAQSAADAAALAAAQQARDELLLDLEDAIGAGSVDWLDLFDLSGGGLPLEGADAAAAALAAQNNSTLEGGAQLTEVDGDLGFQVDVVTDYTVGDSIIPGTESMTAKAQAIAVIQPRCDFAPDADPKKPVSLDCDGVPVDIDPGNFDPDSLPDASVMFSVYLAK
ncbi:pilus assembly protein TadG-related protein [Streptomyces scabiei]|uniref:pilus assembly protein TadG-related protein n=1 Tax=Streptomyces scabiei TaxID=1930 RepID=UPI0022772A9A|nr:pilus assembly protein TadG-related protein [Streptomyces scabiei]MDX2534693.1 pilus assembly protein TadG-related protein [Streptomyces scabiei]MDX2796201.1 pilus assembly protein TadG-related protein [Streptomyces scabiei]MDX2863008.1 pilus assembly protein TadG-related protein [Streptomyces scabiei]MDX3825374.1 pilus assembly protein TadG-related protein [Streptomyces scabiei]